MVIVFCLNELILVPVNSVELTGIFDANVWNPDEFDLIKLGEKMLFTDIVQPKVQPYWQGSLMHPFVRGLQDGTLRADRFRYYLIQDHYYLQAFSHVHQLVAAKTEDAALKTLMLAGAIDLANGEKQVRQTFFEKLQITAHELTQTPIAPTADHYIAHLYRQLIMENAAIAAAGLYPCLWLYGDVGQALSQQPSPHPLYQQWIDTYATNEIQVEINATGRVLNRLFAASSIDDQQQMLNAFIRSSQLEYHFWEMAYQQEQWLSGGKA